jgi:spermatogenesis-associated protein 2
MYSGFYQHEIKNNLMDAEKLFIAMGYKLLPNQTLVLDGPICPDQVTNVSRDALTAYVECQIMKQVNSELTSMGLATSWIEIFNFRECHIGDSSQSLKGLTLIHQSRHNHMLRKGEFFQFQSLSLISFSIALVKLLSFNQRLEPLHQFYLVSNYSKQF